MRSLESFNFNFIVKIQPKIITERVDDPIDATQSPVASRRTNKSDFKSEKLTRAPRSINLKLHHSATAEGKKKAKSVVFSCFNLRNDLIFIDLQQNLQQIGEN